MLPDKAELLFMEMHGIYIPQLFAQRINLECLSGVTPDDMEILRQGPEHDHYWDAWDSVLGNAVLTNSDGERFHLWQDGDLWAIPEGEEVE